MNKKIMRMLAALSAAAAVLCTVGCDKKEDEHPDAADSYGDLAQEDMPYGATITQLKPELDENIHIQVEYDNRYFTEAEAEKISNYVYALDTVDAEFMNTVVYPGYLDQYAEKAGAENLAGYLQICRDNIRDNYIYDEFNFNYVLINDCLTEDYNPDEIANFASVDSLLEAQYGELNITDRKMAAVEILYGVESDDGSYSFSNRQGGDSYMYIYTIEGEPYIIL